MAIMDETGQTLQRDEQGRTQMGPKNIQPLINYLTCYLIDPPDINSHATNDSSDLNGQRVVA